MTFTDGTPEMLADLIYATVLDQHANFEVSVSCAENAKDLFTFCLRMLMLGLLRRQSHVEQLDLLAVTLEDIDFVKERLEHIGIQLHHTAAPLPDWAVLGTNMDVLELMPATLSLEEYVFRMYDGINGVRNDIHFSLSAQSNMTI